MPSQVTSVAGPLGRHVSVIAPLTHVIAPLPAQAPEPHVVGVEATSSSEVPSQSSSELQVSSP